MNTYKTLVYLTVLCISLFPTTTNVSTRNESKDMHFIEELDGFLLKNKTVDEVLNGGASIRIMQTVQLQTSYAINVNSSISAGWISVGGGTSSTSYYRGPAKIFTTTYYLPLINIIG